MKNLNYLINFYQNHQTKPTSENDCFQIAMTLFSGNIDEIKQLAKLTYQYFNK